MGVFIKTGLLAAVALGARAPYASAPAQHSPCVTQADTVRPHLNKFEWIVTSEAPAVLADMDLPSHPMGGVTLVSADSICAEAVAAYNARLTGADTTFRVSRLIVLRAGPTRYVVSRPTSPSGYGFRFWSIWDSTFSFLGALTGK